MHAAGSIISASILQSSSDWRHSAAAPCLHRLTDLGLKKSTVSRYVCSRLLRLSLRMFCLAAYRLRPVSCGAEATAKLWWFWLHIS